MVTVVDLANRLNDGEQINATLLDFSKAVDKVPHRHLLGKLEHCEVRGNPNRWIADFFSQTSE